MQSRMQQHGSKYFAREPLPPQLTKGMGTKGQNSIFSVHKHVAYQPPPPALGWGQLVKIHFFQNMVMLYIKLLALTNAATW